MTEHPDLARLRSHTPSPLADGVSRVFDPLVMVALTVLVVALVRVPSAAVALLWAAVAIVFCVLVPELCLRMSVRRGGAGDRQLVVREDRRTPIIASALSVVAGAAVSWFGGAPAPVRAVLLTVLAGVLVMGLVTRFWKASFHTAVTASMGVVLLVVVGRHVAIPVLSIVVLVGWARVRAGRHDLPQVVAGALLGAATAAAVFPPLV